MGKITYENGADELVLQLKAELAAVVDVLCILHDFIDTSFSSKFQHFCESNSDLNDKVKVLKSLKSKCSQPEIRADSGSSSGWNRNERDETTEAEREETTFSEWPDNVPVVMGEDPLSIHNFAGKCEVELEADDEDPLDFLEDELNVMNPDPLPISSSNKKPSNNHNRQQTPHSRSSSKKAGLLVIRQPPKARVSSSSSSIFINEDNEEEDDDDDRRPHSNSTKSSGSKSGGRFKCSMCPNTYSHETSLKSHFQYKHANRPRVTCPLCGITVRDKCRLDRHFRTHTGEKPFACQHCGRKFSRKDNCTQHLNNCPKNTKLFQTILIG